MFDIEASFDQRILALQKDRPAVVFTEARDPRVLEAACRLARFIRPVFLASEAEVRAVVARDLPHLEATRVDFTLSESAFVDLASSPLLDEMAALYLEICQDQESPPDRDAARAWVTQPGHFGICAVRLGHADMVVGGVAHEPRDFFRPMLRLLARRPVVTEAGVFVLPDEHPTNIFPHNIVVFGDVGVNATMTPEVLADVAAVHELRHREPTDQRQRAEAEEPVGGTRPPEQREREAGHRERREQVVPDEGAERGIERADGVPRRRLEHEVDGDREDDGDE